MKRTDVELLAPAGDLEKLKFAIEYGADAVYIGGEAFGLRAGAKNFDIDQIRQGLEFAHSRGRQVYLTLNIIPHEPDVEALPAYLNEIKDLGLDAVIVADPGTFSCVKKIMPDMEIHLSTQANTTNSASANFWHDAGVKRVVLARELSLEEIITIRKNTPKSLDFESFVHGAMCISYSGRCLLSNYMTGRDANRGDCAQPCRWDYGLVEKKRPGEFFPVRETESGTHVFNSKDLCMVEDIPAVINAGVKSLKVEGRMKTAYYVAGVMRVYREAIDSYFDSLESGTEYKVNPEWIEELKKISNREFTTGFYEGRPGKDAQLYETAGKPRTYDFTGVVQHYDPVTKTARIQQRNYFKLGDEIEVIGPGYFSGVITADDLRNEDGEPIDAARHPRMILTLKTDLELEPGYILRRAKKR